jgi:hypothetical protein
MKKVSVLLSLMAICLIVMPAMAAITVTKFYDQSNGKTMMSLSSKGGR